ncbi:dephospho-CoA kinase [Zavarzinia compransoris]|uniref:Dephospho-CoA kinase n=1 Tax=Zavarzinia compransoris TaxID=1264899 RepID=A0A317E6J3_9PROT|nr:dephospho-CoA kinase [Zavarzinia compransoris]PWR20665.1 dephospho-CoA kinase [Zavarzinia compransoris]TDP44513.1 dephospho-CoA kinase [Zavarzinia compransoris]
MSSPVEPGRGRPLILALTGSIGMGKSETSKMFRDLGIPVYDADAAVHGLYAAGGRAVGPIGEIFPAVVRDGAVDRALLSREIAGDPGAWKKLEAVIHPLVAQVQRDFLVAEIDRGTALVVLDIPLLFETGGQHRADYVAVVSAPAEVQRRRVLERPGMSAEKLDEILSRQVPDGDKRAQADFVIPTDQGLEVARGHVRRVVETLLGDPPPKRDERLA